MFPFANLLSESLFTLGIAVITFFLLLRVYRRSRKSRQSEANGSEFEVTRQATLESEKAALWEVEMEEKLREVEARLDNKIAALEYLVNEADALLARFEEIERRRNGG